MNPFDVVKDFEEAMATVTGAPHAVALDSCSSALLLSLRWNYRKIMEKEASISHLHEMMPAIPVVQIPKHTFISVPTAAIKAGFKIAFVNEQWNGAYHLKPLNIVDSACYLRQFMFQDRFGYGDMAQEAYVCLSFQHRKPLPIGRGGMILHSSAEADAWFRKQRFYGREECPLDEDSGPTELGWRRYMEPEEAASGLRRLHQWNEDNPGGRSVNITYPDLSEIPAFQDHIVNG